MTIKPPPYTWHEFPGLGYRLRYYYDPLQDLSAWIEKRHLFGWRHVASVPTESRDDPWAELRKHLGIKKYVA